MIYNYIFLMLKNDIFKYIMKKFKIYNSLCSQLDINIPFYEITNVNDSSKGYLMNFPWAMKGVFTCKHKFKSLQYFIINVVLSVLLFFLFVSNWEYQITHENVFSLL